MKQITEDVVNEPNESLCESNESIHHTEEMRNIEEKQKYYTAKKHRIQKEPIIDTGSP